MKNLAIASFIIAVLVMFITNPPLFAQPNQVPHENPAMAKGSLNAVELLLFYSNAFDMAANRQYLNAQELLTDLKHADIPEEFQFIINRYTDLSEQLIASLNGLELHLDEASASFSQNELVIAQEKLDITDAELENLRYMLADIETATEVLGEILGVFSTTTTSWLTQSHSRLVKSLDHLGILTDELDALRESIIEDPQITINTSYYRPTRLEVSAPETGYPGVPFTINGRLSQSGDVIDRIIKIYLDDVHLTEATVSDSFSLKVTPPKHISSGKHSLVVVAAPQKEYSEASKILPIEISRIPIQANIKLPKLVIMPQPILVTGEICYESSPVPARVNLSFKDWSDLGKTSTEGTFTIAIRPPPLTITTASASNPFYANTTSIDAPFDLSFVSPEKIKIVVIPAEPWYAPLVVTEHIFVINPVTTGLMFLTLITTGTILSRRGIIKLQEVNANSQAMMPGLPFTTTTPKTAVNYTGSKGTILSCYQDILEAVEETTGVLMARHITLREFLENVSSLLLTARNSFAELTAIAEMALYSAHIPDENAASKAERLAASVKKELSDGTA
ncbi:DUF4129 domain-containing protein [Chloroflexota bacterium]